MSTILVTDRWSTLMAVAVAGVAWLASFPGSAQTTVSQNVGNSNRTVNLNYVYAAELGFGGYSLSGLTANVYTLPLRESWNNVPFKGWELRLLFPVQAGVYSFRATDTDGQHIALDQQSISIVPGVELDIPVGSRSMVKPFAQFGVAHAFGSGVGNPDSWIYRAGARALTQWHVGETTLSLGNAVVFAGDNTIGPGFGERYISLQIGAEVRHPLGFSIGTISPDLGIYVADYYYPAPLQFSRFLKPPLQVANQGEIGFSIGSARPFEILGWSNPRIGVGFVFGGGLDVWHVNFGFQF